MPDYRSTYPVTPYAPGYLEQLELQGMDSMRGPPTDADVQRRADLKKKLLERQKNNPALNPSLPKNFVSKKDKEAADAQNTMPNQTMQAPKGGVGRTSKIKDVGMVPTKLPQAVKNPQGNTFNLNLNFPEPSAMASDFADIPALETPTQDVSPTAPQMQDGRGYAQPISYRQAPSETVSQGPQDTNEPIDYRAKLYEYLKAKAAGRGLQDQDMLQRMGNARDYRAANQLGALFANSASMMGTLQGKRSDVGNFQPLIESIYDRDMGKVQDEIKMRDMGEDQLLREAALASKMQKATAPRPPKVLPYYRPATADSPGEILMYDDAGNLIPRALPPGYEPNTPWNQLPMMVGPQGQPVFVQSNPVTGQTRTLQLPNDVKTLDQMKTQTQSELKQVELQMRAASEAERNQLLREKARLSTQLAEIQRKRLELTSRSQEETRRKNKEQERLGQARLEEAKRAALAKEGIAKTKAEAPGKGPGGQKLTEGERTAGLQADVAINALGQLENMESKGYRPGARSVASESLGRISETLGNVVAGPNDQMYNASNLSLIDQLLRAASGAAVPKDEVRRAMQTYAIRPGDSPQAIAVKQQQRRKFVEALLQKAGGAGAGKKLPQRPGVTVIKKQYSPSRNQTKIIYSDGREEIVNGRQ